MATILSGRSCVEPPRFYRECAERNLPVDWWGAANFFRLPLGRGPGRGKVLLRSGDLNALTQTADQTLTFSGTDPGHLVTLTKLTLVNAKCLSPGAEGVGSAVFLCELVDRRYHLARIPIDRAYNVRAADGASYLSQSLNSGVAWTWQQVVDNLVTALGLDTADFALPFTPDGTPENLTFWGGRAWESLCDVLDRLACAAKYDPVEDTFEVVRLGEDDAAADADLADLDPTRVWDAYALDPARAWRPQKVQVQFIRRPRPTDGSSPYYSVDVTLAADDGVVAGTYVQLKDDLAALGATGTPTNSAALATRATERADDWLRKRGQFERPLMRVFRDFDPSVPGGVLGSTVGSVGIDDRYRMQIEAKAEPDGLLEDWHPLDGLNPLIPIDTGTPSTTTGCDETGWGWVAGLLYLTGPDPDFVECLKLTVLSADGFCAGISTGQVLRLRTTDGVTWTSQHWVDGTPGSWVDEDFTCDTGTGPAIFKIDPTTGVPTLKLCGVTRHLTPTCGGRGVVVFEGGGTDFCDGDTPAASCAENTFRVKLECECCWIDGAEGDGWYCVRARGSDDPCEAVELLDAEGDLCDDTIEICSGPYATQEDAEADCPPPVTVPTDCCPDDETPGTLYMNSTSDPSIPANLPLVYDAAPVSDPGEPGWYSGSCACPTGSMRFRLRCLGSSWSWECKGGAGWLSVTSSLLTADPCDPFTLTADGSAFVNCDMFFGPTFTGTITAVPV